MSVLVFGHSGQVARELRAIGGVTSLSRADADLSDPQSCARIIASHRPSAVINAAAYTGVDQAEIEEELATVINGDAPGAMAVAAVKLDIPFVHISTDYVFDGRATTAWQPDGTTAPIGAYGRSKLAGEQAVRAAGGPHVILRTAWVFSAHGNNFVKTMLRLGDTHEVLNVVADQIGGPTPARDIAAALMSISAAMISRPTMSGEYHYSGAPSVSWADFAREIFAQADRNVTVNNVTTADYPTRARRPGNSVMDCASTLRDFGLAQPDWKDGLGDVLADLRQANAEADT